MSNERHSSRAWVVILVLFGLTTIIEALGVSQVFAFLPLYLQEMGLPQPSIPHWVGVLSALVFVLGLPLVPLWGVWADKYSRKAVIIRSAVVEAVVFALIALSRQPWQLAASMLVVGFQLGNTGVMLAAIRDATPQRRLGTAIALFGACSPVGFAIGPALGGYMIDGLHTPVWAVFAVSSALSLGSALMLAVGLPHIQPAIAPAGRVLDLAYGAIRGVFTDATTRRLFALFGIAFLARQMSTPFMPILVEHVNGGEVALATSVALVVGTASLVGGLISPLAGTLGDRIGFRVVLTVALGGAGITLVLMPIAPSVPVLAVINAVFAALSAAVSAMIFGLLAVEVPADRRSATLNLVYLPLYIAGIVGPALGALVVTAGVSTVFVLSGLVLALGALFVTLRKRLPETANE